MEKVLFPHGGIKLPPRWNRMFPTMERISLRISTAKRHFRNIPAYGEAFV